jgi:DNA polymerase III delta prime subunit
LLELEDALGLKSYPYFTRLSTPEGKKDIPIEDVRKVRNLMALKVPGSKKIRRLIFIEDADNMSHPAQNAILKTLEEPSPHTVFILTSSSVKSVLPTIASRAQQINIRPVSLAEAKKFFKDVDPSTIEGAWSLSRGRVGLLSALIDGASSHPLKISVEASKEFLAHKSYERYISTEELSQDRIKLGLFLEALSRSLAALHRSSLRSGRDIQAAKLLSGRQLTHDSLLALADNASPRLVLLNLVLNLEV